MLLRLMPQEITKYWPVIELSLKKTLTKEEIDSKEKSNNILQSLLIGKLTCWFYKEDNKIKGIMLTAIKKDDILSNKHLLIYSIFTKFSQAQDWITSYEKLSIFAKSVGCSKISFYTRDEKFLKIAKHLNTLSVSYYCEMNVL